MPEVSVIIPNYNHSRYLKERIDSVLAQSYKDFELIILDDNSSDNSKEIINLYKTHAKISNIIFNDVNSNNTFKQWEKGIELATGKFIWLAESDDKADPQFLELLMAGFQQDPDVGLAFCDSFWIDAENNQLNEGKNNDPSSYVLNGDDFIKTHMLSGNRIYNASMAIFKKRIFLEAIDSTYKQFRYSGDYLVWIQMACICKIYFLNKKLNYFRRHATTVSFKADQIGLAFKEGLLISDYIKSHVPLSQAEQKQIIASWINKFTNQYLVVKDLNTKLFFKNYKILRDYDKRTAYLLPIYLIKNFIKLSKKKLKHLMR